MFSCYTRSLPCNIVYDVTKYISKLNKIHSKFLYRININLFFTTMYGPWKIHESLYFLYTCLLHLHIFYATYIYINTKRTLIFDTTYFKKDRY